MGTAAAFLKRLQSVDITELTGQIIAENPNAIADINRKQMLQGKDNKGQPLPPIIGDPWFKKPGADYRYAAFKQKLFPETPFGISNFIVIGVYHNSLSVLRTGPIVRFDASASFAGAIAQKTNNSTLGLNADSQSLAWKTVIKIPLVHRIAPMLGCKISNS